MTQSIVLETSKAITNSEVSLFIGDISGPKANRVADDDSIGSKYTVIVENSTGEKNKKRILLFSARKYILMHVEIIFS